MDQYSSADKEVRWAKMQRFKFIENCLYWHGSIKRQNLVDYFGISTPLASADFGDYLEINPGAMYYDNSEKRYIVADDFNPVFISGDAHSCLAQIYSGEHLFDFVPPVYVRHRLDDIRPNVLRDILNAIRYGCAIEVNISSGWQWVTPVSLVQCGIEWRVEVFWHVSRDYREISLSSIIDTGESRPHDTPPAPIDGKRKIQ